jgi:coenzyme Q-binding protein COQ10
MGDVACLKAAMPAHSETRVLPYSPRQMFDLVADVANYPAFLPWTAAARIRSVTDHGDHQVMLADLVISFKVFRERFGSCVTLWPAGDQGGRIETAYIDGPFSHMESTWSFAPDPGGCAVRFDVDFEFRNRLLQGAAGLFFNEAMQRVVRAFERRARELHGAGQGQGA